MTASLILVRHAAPSIVESEAPSHWSLSEEGRAAAASLAAKLRVFAPAGIVTSPEAKADETARIIGEALGLNARLDDGLVEHRRPGLHFVNAATFQSSVRSIFDRPSERLFDGESADEAYVRFEGAIARHPARPLVVATHGTVLSIYLSRKAGLDAFELWSSLKLPEATVLDARGRLIDRITP
jgi:2,3-bisphosphoglycerate-dependent phosphoglycerate mutase